MKLELQIGVVLDVIFDIIERDDLTKSEKVNMFLKHIEGNDRVGDAFAEFMSWFKLEEGE